MPYVNVDESLWPKMDKCVADVMAKDGSIDKQAAVAICYTSIVEGKSIDTALADVLKIGARNSGTDAQRLQQIHDLAIENGAKCPDPNTTTMPMPKAIDESLITFGAEVKALGGGKVGGYLVRFSTSADPDLTGDFFTKQTDFGGATRSDVYYQHGLDAKIGKRKIGDASLTFDDVGAWVDAQLNMRDEYEKAIYQLAEKNKLNWSSGTAAHLVERKPAGKAHEIIKWPLGLDASLTPTPAEPRNSAIPLKSFQPTTLEVEATPQAEQENRDETQTPTAAADQPTNNQGAKKMADEVQTTPQADPVAELTASVKALKDQFEALKKEPPMPMKGFAINTTGLGDSETKSFLHYWRTGQIDPNYMKASNAVDMQEGTAGEGGVTVPTGLYNQIIARKMEMSLSEKLGLRPIPGKGLTVNVPYDDEADGEFVSTNEEAAFDVDTPALNVAAMTLVKYTKEMLISYELLEDEDAKLEAFIADWIGRGLAKTQNSLIVTAAASGTALKTYASATAIAVGELEAMVYNSNVSYYLDDSNSNAWVMRPSTYAAIANLGSTSLRWYAGQEQGSNAATLKPTLLGYPVYFSEKAAATAASAKDVYFGNWNYMGKREPTGLTVLRDPYSNAHTGRLTMRYYFRTKYLVLQAAAIGYGVHPSA